ncbi:dTDP-4-dehydrorhamnose reductase, partial [Streptomyces zhihengii]
RRDGLDPARLPSSLRSGTGLPGGLDVRLDSRMRAAARSRTAAARAV